MIVFLLNAPSSAPCVHIVFSFFVVVFLLFHNVRLSLRKGHEAERHLKAFEQISSAPIPHADCPTGVVTYTVSYLMI